MIKQGTNDIKKVMAGTTEVKKVMQGTNPIWELDTGMQATGGTIYQSGGYTYHKFTSNGTFNVTKNPKQCDYIVVGGGGGGGTAGAGGGAGAAATGSFTPTIDKAIRPLLVRVVTQG